jgi:ribosomal protein S14
MKLLYIKDKNRRYCFLQIEKKRLILKYILHNFNLKSAVRFFAYTEFVNLMQMNSLTKIRNRCFLSNRARAVYRKFKVSRIFFKKYSLQGDFMGIKKASW